MKLILFDIDGTLMHSGGAGTKAVESAICEVLGMSCKELGENNVSMAGKTDPQILKEILEILSVSYDSEMLKEILGKYLSHLSVEIAGSGKRLMPSVIETLDWLGGIGNAHLGLLTGNIKDGARIKLSSLGIWEKFGFGAYGSDNEDRNMLLPEALGSFRSLTGQEVTFRDCIVIGDTPRDVECSKPYGAYSLAVATGPYDMDALNNTDADAVIRDLSDAREVLSPLLSA
jgi:phosphoglycolate phosphatase-like HAD superfamily hydrolase